MPRSRAKLAVPFISKDVPSPASEFAQPDIVIGLTVLAYRIEVSSRERSNGLHGVDSISGLTARAYLIKERRAQGRSRGSHHIPGAFGSARESDGSRARL